MSEPCPAHFRCPSGQTAGRPLSQAGKGRSPVGGPLSQAGKGRSLVGKPLFPGWGRSLLDLGAAQPREPALEARRKPRGSSGWASRAFSRLTAS
jgi:hypothetical protein